MRIVPINAPKAEGIREQPGGHEPTTPFEQALNKSIEHHRRTIDASTIKDVRNSSTSDTYKTPTLLEVGTLDKENFSVWHLLKKNPVFGKDTEKIIHHELNLDKPYTTIPRNATILINPDTMEITWRAPREAPPEENTGLYVEFHQAKKRRPLPDRNIVILEHISKRPVALRNEPDCRPETIEETAVLIPEPTIPSTPIEKESQEKILLGTISRNRPTIASLLRDHPQYRPRLWKIINHKINLDKPFKQIQNGSNAYIDPATNEITWSNPSVDTAGKKPITG